jgi:hypothetical protein
MFNYSTKRIEYLFNGDDTILKKFLKKYFFKQNPYVQSYYRSPNIKFKRTLVEQAEWDKCKNDIIYFAENYFWINNLSTLTIELIKLYPYQVNILKSYVEGKTIVCNSRQMGITTMNEIYALWSLLFNTQYIQIVTDPIKAHYDFMDIIRSNYIKLPYHMQKGVAKFNKHEIVCDDYSRITDSRFKISDRKDAIKYFSMIIDNAAFLHKADLIDIERKLKFNIKSIITSTPNGYNEFYKLWLDSITSNHFKFKPIKLLWHENPKYTDMWANEMLINMGQKSFDEEISLKFINKSN